MKKRMLLIGLVAAVLIAIFLQLFFNKKKIEAQKKPVAENTRAIPVQVVTVNEQQVNDDLIKTGNLIPNKEADITSVSGGRLVAVQFELGNYVRQGQQLAQVDNRSLQLSLEAARLAKTKADKDLKRFKALLEGEATTEVTFQDAKLNAENAANQIEQIEKQMADNRIKAPINGQIVSKHVENGEFVGPGTVLGHIVDISRLKVNVLVSEIDVYTLKLGQNVRVRTDIYPDRVFNGKITFISNSGDATHNYPVEIALDNPKDAPLKAGTFAYVDFNRTSHTPMLLIPRSALLRSIQNPEVYVVENGKAVLRKITVGKDYGENIEVLSGLKNGETVVTSGQINVREGISIREIRQ